MNTKQNNDIIYVVVQDGDWTCGEPDIHICWYYTKEEAQTHAALLKKNLKKYQYANFSVEELTKGK